MGLMFGDGMKVFSVVVLFVAGGLVRAGVLSGVNNCSEFEFPCDNGRQCVLKNKWCDTTEDCEDDSDEEHCHFSSSFNKDPNFCNGAKFICGNGPCIPFSGVCDGVVSCSDGSDEQGCRNSSTETTLEVFSTEKVTTVAVDMNQTSVKTAWLAQNMTAYEVLSKPSPSAGAKSLPTSSSAQRIATNSTESTTTRPSTPFHTKGFAQTSSSINVTALPTRSATQRIATNPKTSHAVPVIPLKDYIPLKSAVIRYPITREQDFARLKAEAWLIKQYHSFSENDIPRAVVALNLSNKTFFSEDSAESKAISRLLQLKITSDLLRNRTKTMGLSDLALYVNALLASCHNPHNFYGVDLAFILRMRTDAVMSGEFISPSVYLTLCLLEKGSQYDIEKLREIFVTANEQLLRLDIQALAILAASCFSKVPEFSSLSKKLYASPSLIMNRLSNESYSDVYTTALLSQALTVAGVTVKDWKRTEAIDFMLSSQNPDGSFGDVLATYYVMPTLSGNDLESLRDGCYTNPEKSGSSWLEPKAEEPESLVDISVCFGNLLESVQSLQLKVKDGADFLKVLEKAEKTNSVFRLKYDQLTKPPTIYAIGDIANDAERGLFWYLHVTERKYPITKDYLITLKPFMGDIRNLTVKNGSHSIFWFRNVHV